jgi:hypothetical protein
MDLRCSYMVVRYLHLTPTCQVRTHLLLNMTYPSPSYCIMQGTIFVYRAWPYTCLFQLEHVLMYYVCTYMLFYTYTACYPLLYFWHVGACCYKQFAFCYDYYNDVKMLLLHVFVHMCNIAYQNVQVWHVTRYCMMVCTWLWHMLYFIIQVLSYVMVLLHVHCLFSDTSYVVICMIWQSEYACHELHCIVTYDMFRDTCYIQWKHHHLCLWRCWLIGMCYTAYCKAMLHTCMMAL